jgi:hypothetical protein
MSLVLLATIANAPIALAARRSARRRRRAERRRLDATGILRRPAHIAHSQEARMSDPVEALILDLLEWIDRRPRPYAEVIETWRTSCPRLPVWEEANARGFLTREHEDGVGATVFISVAGREFLAAHRRRQTA